MKTKNRLGNNYGDQVKLSQSTTQRHLVGFGLCLDHATKTRLTGANTRDQGTSKKSVHPIFNILPREVALQFVFLIEASCYQNWSYM